MYFISLSFSPVLIYLDLKSGNILMPMDKIGHCDLLEIPHSNSVEHSNTINTMLIHQLIKQALL